MGPPMRLKLIRVDSLLSLANYLSTRSALSHRHVNLVLIPLKREYSISLKGMPPPIFFFIPRYNRNLKDFAFCVWVFIIYDCQPHPFHKPSWSFGDDSPSILCIFLVYDYYHLQEIFSSVWHRKNYTFDLNDLIC